MLAGLRILILLLLGTAAGWAQTETFTIHPEQSEVVFSLADVLHQVHGTFQVESGSVRFDRSSGQMSGSIVVAAGSGKSGNATRDRRMSVDILDAPQFADASFLPRRLNGAIAPSGDSTVQVDGVIMLHGRAHDLTVPMQVRIEGESCTAKAHFMIPYVRWGLKDPSTFLLRVNTDVELEIVLAGQLSKGK